MKVLVYSAHGYDQLPLEQSSKGKHELVFTAKALNDSTSDMADGFDAVALFTSDNASKSVIDRLSARGVKYIALRSVGFDHVDLKAAKAQQIAVANVPEYSPYAVAEHAVALLMAADRHLEESRALMRLQDFRLDTLTGFDIHGKTVGIIGMGKIGLAFAAIMKGFGTHLLAFDPAESSLATNMGVGYVSLEELLKRSDIISIHCPLNDTTRHLLSKPQFSIMKKGVVLINTARGAIINTADLVDAIVDQTVGAACLDVYENEKGIFFEDRRTDVISDPLFARLRTFKNVVMTGHQGFLTNEALAGIANVTIDNLDYWQRVQRSPNEIIV